MDLGFVELIIIVIIVNLLMVLVPAAVIGWVLWKVLKDNNRVSVLESRIERLERQLDRTSEPIAPVDRRLFR